MLRMPVQLVVDNMMLLQQTSIASADAARDIIYDMVQCVWAPEIPMSDTAVESILLPAVKG